MFNRKKNIYINCSAQYIILYIYIYEEYRKKKPPLWPFTEKKTTNFKNRKEKNIFCSKMFFSDDHSKTIPKIHSVTKNNFLDCSGSFAIGQNMQKSEISWFFHVLAYTNEPEQSRKLFFVTECLFGSVL